MNNPLEKYRNDFPLLSKSLKEGTLVYFDNAATTQKPFSVVEQIEHFYKNNNANVHRGTYALAHDATLAYENARYKISQFISAKSSAECVFVKGTTEGINLVANGFTHQYLKPDDEILITHVEHHSNIVPWQLACQYTGARLRVAPCNENGELDVEKFSRLINNKTKLISIAHISNVLGIINPIKQCIALAHSQNIPVLIDGAQAAGHLSLNVKDLDCDFYAFSGHKMYGPTGIGVLYGKEAWLEKLPPYQGGGEMIQSVTLEKTEYNVLPYKFEAGTPPIASAVGLGAAIDYLNKISFSSIHSHEAELIHYITTQMRELAEVTLLGDVDNKVGILSFNVNNIHPHDLATYLDHHGIALRAGQLCAEPLLLRLGYKSLLRVSFGLYNTTEEIDYFIHHLKNGIRYFKR